MSDKDTFEKENVQIETGDSDNPNLEGRDQPQDEGVSSGIDSNSTSGMEEMELNGAKPLWVKYAAIGFGSFVIIVILLLFLLPLINGNKNIEHEELPYTATEAAKQNVDSESNGIEPPTKTEKEEASPFDNHDETPSKDNNTASASDALGLSAGETKQTLNQDVGSVIIDRVNELQVSINKLDELARSADTNKDANQNLKEGIDNQLGKMQAMLDGLQTSVKANEANTIINGKADDVVGKLNLLNDKLDYLYANFLSGTASCKKDNGSVAKTSANRLKGNKNGGRKAVVARKFHNRVAVSKGNSSVGNTFASEPVKTQKKPLIGDSITDAQPSKVLKSENGEIWATNKGVPEYDKVGGTVLKRKVGKADGGVSYDIFGAQFD